MKHKRALLRDDGAAMVEFAIVIPVLLLLLVGIFNLGFLAAQKVETTNAARQGARAAVVRDTPGTTATAKAKAAVDNSVASGTLKSPSTNVSTSFGGTTCGTAGSVGKDMKVTVKYTNPGWMIPVPFFKTTAPSLTSEAWYRCEW